MFLTGRISPPLMSAYCISKYGVEAFSDALRREMSPWGVLVSMIEPGRFKTSISNLIIDSVKQLWEDLSPELKKDYGDKYFRKCKFMLYFVLSRKKNPTDHHFNLLMSLTAMLHQTIFFLKFRKYIPLTNRVRGPYRKLRTEFFPLRYMAQARSARAINRREKKRGSVTYSTDPEDEVSKIFIISLLGV